MPNADCPICGGDPRWEVAGYCSHVHVKGGPNPSLSKIRPAPLVSRQDLDREWEERMAAAVAKVAPVNPPRRTASAGTADGGTTSSDAASGDGDGTTSLASAGSTAPRPKGRRQQKASKRTSEQVKRATERAKRSADYREWWTTLGTVAEGQQADEDAFLAAVTRHEEKD